ncbi:hypothetical protein J3459_005941 [Metarhizium acridum]|nr:hypothetical protein J3459_005941 [Metarhizium acridum]
MTASPWAGIASLWEQQRRSNEALPGQAGRQAQQAQQARRGHSAAAQDGTPIVTISVISATVAMTGIMTGTMTDTTDVTIGMNVAKANTPRTAAEGGIQTAKTDTTDPAPSRQTPPIPPAALSRRLAPSPTTTTVKDHQLPLYAERLRDWTSHPGQIRNFNRKALKGQIKGLHASWKSIKRAQRQTRKAYRRERRMQRRAEKREYRNQRREMRRAHKNYRRHGGPFHVQPPPIPPVPQAPPAPPAPPGPTAGPNPPPWTQNWPRGCTGPSQRSSFFFGPDGPLGERGPFGHRGAFGGPRGGPFGRGGWGSWARGCGANMAGGGPWGPAVGGNLREAPGAWPEEDHESGVSSHIPPPGAGPRRSTRAAEQIEAEIAKLATKAAGAKEGRAAMEKEIEALTDKLEAVRMEADEAYARELAE